MKEACRKEEEANKIENIIPLFESKPKPDPMYINYKDRGLFTSQKMPQEGKDLEKAEQVQISGLLNQLKSYRQCSELKSR